MDVPTNGMENLIPLINKLQDVFTAVGSSPIELPQLVVVGSQSSGKSSVLEHIVGRDFLPRGAGIVTRRPLVLQLINTRKDEEEIEEDEEVIAKRREDGNSTEEWGEFLHAPNKRFTNFNEIRDEIVRDTDRLTGSNKGVSNQPINLKIFSPHVLNLTLVDLPGITKVPVGDQPSNIEQLIRDMIMQYISSPNSIIIAVSPANSDLANSDALKLAREVDPAGMRTLGVITKIDLMDKGTDAMNVLVGNVIPLHHGFVGVVNRSQLDINQGRSISHALKAEKQYFLNHPAYRQVANKMGTSYLAKRLNAILMSHIQDCLPEMRQKITLTISETQAELESYGLGPSAQISTQEMGSILLPMISRFCTNFNEALEGRSVDVSSVELYGGARISYVFREMFGAALEHITPTDQLTDHDIRTAIRNASGPRPSLFIPEISFELLVKKQIERLLAPSLDCVDLVYHELQRVSLQCEQLSPQLIRFPRLRSGVVEVFQSLLQSRCEPTKAYIQNLVNCELSYINTNHPDFIGGSKAVHMIMETMQLKKQQEEKERAAKAIEDHSHHHHHHHTHSSPNKSVNLPIPTSTPSTSSSSSSTSSSSSSSRPQKGFLNMFFRSGSTSPSPAPATPAVQPSPAVTTSSSQSQATNSSFASPALALSSKMDQTLPLDTHNAHAHESDLYSGIGSMSNVGMTYQLRSIEPTEREQMETEVIKALIDSYYNIVRKTIQDHVPKSIMCFLVNHVKAHLQAELVRHLYKPELMDTLLKEADDIAEKRASCQELLSILHRALEILNTARDFNALA